MAVIYWKKRDMLFSLTWSCFSVVDEQDSTIGVMSTNVKVIKFCYAGKQHPSSLL